MMYVWIISLIFLGCQKKTSRAPSSVSSLDEDAGEDLFIAPYQNKEKFYLNGLKPFEQVHIATKNSDEKIVLIGSGALQNNGTFYAPLYQSVSKIQAYRADQLIDEQVLYTNGVTPLLKINQVFWPKLDYIYSPEQRVYESGFLEAWTQQPDCSSIVFAVLDTGVYRYHPNLRKQLWIENNFQGYNFVDYQRHPVDTHPQSHGTMLAGLLSSGNEDHQGVIGLCPKSKIMPLKVFDEAGITNLAKVLEAMQFARRYHASIVLYTGSLTLLSDSLMQKALLETLKKEIFLLSEQNALVILAAGNENKKLENSFLSGAENLSNVLIVTSIDKDLRKSSFANYHPEIIHLAAPGSNIYSTMSPKFSRTKNYYGFDQGTGFAAAIVAAAAGLLKQHYPNWSAAQIKQQLLKHADSIPELQDFVYKGKKLNIFKAIFPPVENIPPVLRIQKDSEQQIIVYNDSYTALKEFSLEIRSDKKTLHKGLYKNLFATSFLKIPFHLKEVVKFEVYIKRKGFADQIFIF